MRRRTRPNRRSARVSSEERSLPSQRLRVDGLLPGEALQLAGTGGAVTGEVIVEEAEDVFGRGGTLQHIRPDADLLRTVELHARIVGNLAVRSHPSHVEKVRRRTRCEVQHRLARYPAAVAERESDIVARQQVEKLRQDFGAYPAPVPKLDRESQLARQRREEVFGRR